MPMRLNPFEVREVLQADVIVLLQGRKRLNPFEVREVLQVLPESLRSKETSQSL